MRLQAVPLVCVLVHCCQSLSHHCCVPFDLTGRFYFLNAIANNLRFPNSHTHYFSWVLLYMFVEAKSELVQEQITRCVPDCLISLFVCLSSFTWLLI